MENAGRGAGVDDFFVSRNNKILVSLVATAGTSGGVS